MAAPGPRLPLPGAVAHPPIAVPPVPPVVIAVAVPVLPPPGPLPLQQVANIRVVDFMPDKYSGDDDNTSPTSHLQLMQDYS